MFRNSKKSSPAGTLGGACGPNVTIRGVAQPRCAPPLVCGYDGIGKRVCKAPAPGYKPGSPGKPAPAGTLGMPCTQVTDNLSTCEKGLTCVPGVPSPVCMPTPSGPGPSPSGPTPGKKPDPGSYGMPCIQVTDNVSTCGKGLTCVPGVPSPVCMPTPPGPSGPSGPATKSGMGSKEILTIIGLIFLGLCFLCGLAKMGMKDAKRKSNCDKACGAFVFLGVTLIAVSSVLKSSN